MKFSLNLNKIYEICYVGKRTFENGKVVSTKVAADSFILLKLLSRYVKKYNKSIILQLKSKKLSCAGVEGPLGHPKVYLDMGDDNQIVCPYCSKLFILK